MHEPANEDSAPIKKTGVCYFLVCFKSQEYVSYLLAALYRKEDYFIVHCDLKAPQQLKSYLKELVRQHDNIYLMESQPYSWAGFSHVDVCLKANSIAISRSQFWSHLIFLSEQHLPLKSPQEIADYLINRKSVVAIRSVDLMGEGERSDIENRFSGHYRELPGVGCFVVGLSPRDKKFYESIYHGSNWMILCRDHCQLIDNAKNEGRFESFKSVVHSEETAIPSILRDCLEEIELRDAVLVATPDISDNHDLVMTEELFRSHIQTDFLFIRKRTQDLSPFVDKFIKGNNFDEAVYRCKSNNRVDLTDQNELTQSIVYNFCMHTLKRFKNEPSIKMIDKKGHSSVPSFYAIIEHSDILDNISVRVLSEDLKNFKVLIVQHESFGGIFSNQSIFEGFVQSIIRSRIYDLFGNKDFLPISVDGAGFVSIPDESDIEKVSSVAAEFVDQAIELSRSITSQRLVGKNSKIGVKCMRAQRLNALAGICNAKRYLEVGVCNGDTFFEIEVPYKVAVDPNFLFDYSAKADKDTVFEPVVSDTFFETSNEAPFDLIYLDGLHTYEQNTRDFINSLRFSHDRTIWVIDDTVPHDVFSALPDQQKCYELRHKLSQGDWFWMGDVYKTIFFIERMFPFFQFRTYSGHGQTVIWKSSQPRALNKSHVSLERIGGMNYLDFIENLSIMNILDDNAIVSAIAGDLKA